MILTKAQAEAIYRAMSELNNVGALIRASGLDKDGLELRQRGNEIIVIGYLVDDSKRGTVIESYANQTAFAAAYGLN